MDTRKPKMLEHGIYFHNALVGMDWLDVDGKVKTMCAICKIVPSEDKILNKLYEKDEFVEHLATHSNTELREGMFGKKENDE